MAWRDQVCKEEKSFCCICCIPCYPQYGVGTLEAFFASFFKKTVTAKKEALNIQCTMILDYSSQHITEVLRKMSHEGSCMQ